MSTSPAGSPEQPLDDAPTPLLRFGLCSVGHSIRVKSDLTETRDGFACRRCVDAMRAERDALRLRMPNQ